MGYYTLCQRAETTLHNFSAASILSTIIFPMCPVLRQSYFYTVQTKLAIFDSKVGTELQTVNKLHC